MASKQAEMESEIRTKKNKLEDKLIDFFTKLIDDPSYYIKEPRISNPEIELILKYLKS